MATRKRSTARYITLREDQLREMMEESSQKGVQDAFLLVGIDISTPAGVIQAQRDWDHLRGWRKASDHVKRQGVITAAGIIIAALLGMVYAKISGSAN